MIFLSRVGCREFGHLVKYKQGLAVTGVRWALNLGSGGATPAGMRGAKKHSGWRGRTRTKGCCCLPTHTTHRPPCLSPECCNNQKLLLEYEKYQELQLKSQRMQEEYEKQLRDNDETKSQALEELTEFYEAKLQEKTSLLEEVIPGSRAPPSGL